MLWKVPAKGNKKLSLQARLPVNCINKTQTNTQLINAAFTQHWITFCVGGLVKRSVSIAGLESTRTIGLCDKVALVDCFHLRFASRLWFCRRID